MLRKTYMYTLCITYIFLTSRLEDGHIKKTAKYPFKYTECRAIWVLSAELIGHSSLFY